MNFFSGLKKINLVKKVATNFIQNSKFRKAKNLKKHHYQIIGDIVNDQKPDAFRKDKFEISSKVLSFLIIK